MPATIIQGREIAHRIKAELKDAVRRAAAAGHPPHLVALEVDSNAASRLYLQNQQRSCEDLGIRFTLK